jgi:hypothetical protein
VLEPIALAGGACSFARESSDDEANRLEASGPDGSYVCVSNSVREPAGEYVVSSPVVALDDPPRGCESGEHEAVVEEADAGEKAAMGHRVSCS